MIKLVSFSYRQGPPPREAAVVIDCRKYRNPFSIPLLRPLNGTHSKVQNYMTGDPGFMTQLNWLVRETLVLDDVTVACGCHGGHHRSVAMIEMLGKALRASSHAVEVKHTELA